MKREDATEEKPSGKVSSYLHGQIEQGDIVILSGPAGDLTLNIQDDRPVVFISGGVGLTSFVSMISSLAATDPNL